MRYNNRTNRIVHYFVYYIMKKIIAVLLGIVIFLFGLGLGIIYQQQNGSRAAQNAYQQMVQVLRSKLVRSVLITGKIQAISPTQVTIASTETALPVLLTDSTKISVIDIRNNAQNTTAKAGNSSDLQAGRTVNITSSVGEDGQFQANNIQVIVQ